MNANRLLIRSASILSALLALLTAWFYGNIETDALWSLIGYVSLFAVISLGATEIVQRWAWARTKILRIPDFSGRWEGWCLSDLSNADWQPISLEVSQVGASVTATAYRSHNFSRTVASSMYFDTGDNAPELYLSYEAKSAPTNDDEFHYGTFRLAQIMDEKKCELVGRYFNDRLRYGKFADGTRGACGYLHFRQSKLNFRRQLGYDKGNWALSHTEALAYHKSRQAPKLATSVRT